MDNQASDKAQTGQSEGSMVGEAQGRGDKLGRLGWALFFIWVGLAFLGDFDVGVSLLGIGLITLGMQIVRKIYSLAFEGFWVVIGILFAIGGLWEIYETDLPLVPILLILAGLLMLISLTIRKKPTRQ